MHIVVEWELCLHAKSCVVVIRRRPSYRCGVEEIHIDTGTIVGAREDKLHERAQGPRALALAAGIDHAVTVGAHSRVLEILLAAKVRTVDDSLVAVLVGENDIVNRLLDLTRVGFVIRIQPV